MSYEEALQWLGKRVQQTSAVDASIGLGSEIQEVLAAIQTEHDRVSQLLEDLDVRFVRQTGYIEQLHQERKEFAAGATDPDSIAAHPLTTDAALAFLKQLSAWFYRQHAPEFARNVNACRRALKAKQERADGMAPQRW